MEENVVSPPMLLPIDYFSVVPLIATNSSNRTHQLAVDGYPIGLVMHGDVLRAQFLVEQNYLLITDNSDNIWENHLTIYYLGDTFEIKDKLTMGAPYYGGTLRNVQTVGERTIHFSFFDDEDDRWEVKVITDDEYESLQYHHQDGCLNKLNKYVLRFKCYETPDS